MGGAARALSIFSLSSPLPLLSSRRSSSALLHLSAAAALISWRRRASIPPRRLHLRSVRQVQTLTVVSIESGVRGLSSSRCGEEDVASAWPEWARLVPWLADEGYVDRAVQTEDEFDEGGELGLSEEFVRVGKGLMLFARENPDLLRSLSKKEIGIVVDNVSPILFKDGGNSTKRLRNFLNGGNNDVLQQEKAETVDLVRFLLSYASNFEKNGNNVITDASAKNLLVELITLSGTTRLPNFTDPSEKPPLSQQQDQSSGPPPGQTIPRKAGDWFCSKCNFMNFARNTKCLECSEPKPKRILTGKEWECPQCNFFNYGKNMSCLRCDCKRSGDIPLPTHTLSKTSNLEDILNKSTIEVSSNAPHAIKNSGKGYEAMKDPVVSQTVDRLLSREPSKTPCESLENQKEEPDHILFNPLPPMFAKSKTTKIEVNSNSSVEEFPQMMPVRNGENRFVVSRKKDRSLTTPQYKRRIAMERANNSNADFVPFVPFPPDYFAKKRENKLPEMRHGSEKTQETSTRGIDTNSSHEVGDASQEKNMSEYSNRQEATNSSDLGHFVPFPPDYFAKKRDNKLSETGQVNEKTEDNNTRDLNTSSLYEAHESEQQRKNSVYSGHPNLNSNSQKVSNGQSEVGDVNGSYSTRARHISGYDDNRSYPKTSSSSSEVSWNKTPEGSSIKESNSLDMSEEAKAERWFKRAAQIKDISELENIPDEDFPEIMPMRKGVNRFVVSKRKTPLERRLASSEYRGNLSSIKSDPDKDKGFNFDRS